MNSHVQLSELFISCRTNADENSLLPHKRARHEVSSSEQRCSHLLTTCSGASSSDECVILTHSAVCNCSQVSGCQIISNRLTVVCFRWLCPRVCHLSSEWRAQRVWIREQMMTAYLQKASTVYHTVKKKNVFSLRSSVDHHVSIRPWYLTTAFTPKSVCPVRHRLTVQPVSIAPTPHWHLQPCQLESPSHTANANGRRAAIGSDGVTWSGWQDQPGVRRDSLCRWLFQ